MKSFKNFVVISSLFSIFVVGSLYAAEPIARGTHPATHATHPVTNPAQNYHPGNYYHPAVNHGIENQAFNRGVEAGAVEGAAANGAAVDTGFVDPNPVYLTPTSTQPAVQYVVPAPAPAPVITTPQ